MTYESNKYYFDSYIEDRKKARVFIVLRSAKIYTIVTRQELFDKGLFRGCFIETVRRMTPELSAIAAMSFIAKIGARYVTLEDFNRIEKESENDLVAAAFAEAEDMIARG